MWTARLKRRWHAESLRLANNKLEVALRVELLHARLDTKRFATDIVYYGNKWWLKSDPSSVMTNRASIFPIPRIKMHSCCQGMAPKKHTTETLSYSEGQFLLPFLGFLESPTCSSSSLSDQVVWWRNMSVMVDKNSMTDLSLVLPIEAVLEPIEASQLSHTYIWSYRPTLQRKGT